MKNVPNILTIGRVILVPFFILFFYQEMYLASLIIFIVASVTDYFDGMIARKYNLVSNFGKFMDPLADKILTYSAFCLFVEKGYFSAWMFAIVLFREFAVAGIRMLAAEKGTVVAADIFGKIKTVFQMIGIPMLILSLCELGNISETVFSISHVIIEISVLMTVVSGFNYIRKNISVLKE